MSFRKLSNFEQTTEGTSLTISEAYKMRELFPLGHLSKCEAQSRVSQRLRTRRQIVRCVEGTKTGEKRIAALNTARRWLIVTAGGHIVSVPGAEVLMKSRLGAH